MKQPSPKRDYRAEYARRVERGIARGLSRSQARGHPKAREKNIRKSRPIDDAAFQISLKALRSGASLAQAAGEIHVSPERLRNQARELGIIKRRGRRWIVRSTIPRRMLIYSNGEAKPIVLGTFRHASKAGRYMSAVRKFLQRNNPAALKPFIGKSVTDINGKAHVFETDPNTLYRLDASGTQSFEEIYRYIT